MNVLNSGNFFVDFFHFSNCSILQSEELESLLWDTYLHLTGSSAVPQGEPLKVLCFENICIKPVRSLTFSLLALTYCKGSSTVLQWFFKGSMDNQKFLSIYQGSSYLLKDSSVKYINMVSVYLISALQILQLPATLFKPDSIRTFQPGRWQTLRLLNKQRNKWERKEFR